MNPFLAPTTPDGGSAWQALAHNGLASHAQEWGREWNRAQARAWLHQTPQPEPPRHAVRSLWSGSHDAPPGNAAGPDVQALASRPMTAAEHFQPVALSIGDGAGVPPVTRSSAGAAPATAAETRDAAGLRAMPSERATPLPRALEQRQSMRPLSVDDPGPRSENNPVRLHVEESDEGLRVWIGADGEEALVCARAAAILAELRRSESGSSFRLASLVCNGQTFYACSARPPSPPENPR